MQVSWQVKSSKCFIFTIEDNCSLVSCKLGFIPQLSLKHDHCCDGNLLSERDQCNQDRYNQVSSSWHMVHGLVHSMLDANRWQLHAVQPHANACKQVLHQTLKLVAIR